ncbi:MAG: hypothetical protein LBB04_03225 [Oscillospiraceae bacterium]|jgi:hypothetical protein|nr:hypothetical protein [Oscillospiraceae bacterium]
MKLEKAKLLLGLGTEMELQFNPVTYVLSCPKEVNRVYEDITKKEEGLPNSVVSGSRDEARVFGCKLVFDSSSNEEGAVINNVTRRIVDFAKNQLGKSPKTVQENLETFFEMVETSQQCQYNGLTFAWGDFIFHGLVNRADVEYKMFLSNGEPARANIAIAMTETPDPDGFSGRRLGDLSLASTLDSLFGNISSVVSKGLSEILPGGFF